MEWTSEQRHIIDARGSNLIVSAAAGSGKTAVLVERICGLVASGEADLDHILVVTFTRAAAAEMRRRIVTRLTAIARQQSRPDRRLNDQLLKIDRAPIGTLHSFCGDILRQHYNIVGIEPSFQTEDESVTADLFDDTLNDTIDDFFEAGDERFLHLANCWGGRDGDGLADVAAKVYGAARNYPAYLDWLKAAVDRFDFADGEQTAWYPALKQRVRICLVLAGESIREAIKAAKQPGGPECYLPRLQEDLEGIAAALAVLPGGSREEIADAVLNMSAFNRMPQWRNPQDKALGEWAKLHREEAKKQVRHARENPIVSGWEDAVEHTRAMHPQMLALVDLIAEFDRRYSEEKRYRNVLDFSDLEHLALAVLEDEDARLELQNYYDYVFVDEYQDISPIQDALLNKISRQGNFFCVGDVKQSIYRFRSAEPEIFLNRLERSSRAADAHDRRIDLNRNFRSAGRVVSLANFLFDSLMTRPLGGVDYTGSERLEPGAARPESEDPRCSNELILIDNGGKDEDELTHLEELIQIEREATVVADRIREIVGTSVWDGKAGLFRPARYQDITVLLRTVSSVAADYAEVFRRNGIPVYAESESGFAGEVEVQLLMNLLRLVDHSSRDFELITTMHSAIGRFSLEDLLEIRGLYPGRPFAGAVAEYAELKDSDLADRVREFLGRVDRWRDLARYGGAAKLLDAACEDTGFFEYAGTLPEGRRRQANILHLTKLAREYQGSLYDFIRNFDRLAQSGVAASGQPAGAVVIMSVHKSKGLEFPVVFLSNIGKRINLQDARESMLTNGDLGLGPRYFNDKKRTRADTLARAALLERTRRDTLSEEMRMLYVAVTRARERLILVGTVSDLKGRVVRWSLPLTAEGLAARAQCWADWVGPMALRTAQGQTAFEGFGAGAEALPDGPADWAITVLDAGEIKNRRPEAPDRQAALAAWLNTVQNTEIPDEMRTRLDWSYPWGDVAALPSKVSATSLLDRQRNWRGPVPAPEIRRLPRFLEEDKGFSATDLGTFVHTALQLLPFDMAVGDIPEKVCELEQRGLLPEGASSAINIDWIVRFFRSDIAGRIRRSDHVEREVPFNLAIPAHVVYPGETSQEDILVQGIIDCCFMEEGEWVLVDYKTNRVDGGQTSQSLADHYKPQLQTYRSALEEITGVPVREAYLYLLSVGMELAVRLG